MLISDKSNKSTPRIIVALDDPNMPQLHALLEQLHPDRCRLKVGKALFTRLGPSFVEKLVQRGYDIFLDLKFHDIPQQVFNACQAAADLNVWMLTVHASGGTRMLTAAKEALAKTHKPPLLVAVTVLTSLSQHDLDVLGIPESIEQHVLRLGKIALDSGVDGLVCAPNEVTLLRQQLSSHCCLVTPGIRPSGTASDDQQRTLTPRQAIEAGADYLVIGRPITQSSNPLESLNKIEVDIFAQPV